MDRLIERWGVAPLWVVAVMAAVTISSLLFASRNRGYQCSVPLWTQHWRNPFPESQESDSWEDRQRKDGDRFWLNSQIETFIENGCYKKMKR